VVSGQVQGKAIGDYIVEQLQKAGIRPLQ
jgi:hypothetical protein